MIASEEAVNQNGLKPLARLVAYSTVGVPPEIMGIGPVPAIQNVLKVSGLSLSDIDLIEVDSVYKWNCLEMLEYFHVIYTISDQ